ncbi:MAG: EscU/YscU/HrcU family type III secretion system export apparatus switch protein [Hydrogenobaculum sp.]
MDEKEKKAIALKYERGKDNAPRLVAKGKGYIAQKIVELAKEHQVPIIQDEKLLSAAYNLDIYEEVPPELYKAVAKVLVFVEKLKKRL